MALKKLKIKCVVAPQQKNDIPIIDISGDLVAQYLKADQQKKAAEEVIKDLRPELVEAGVHEILERSSAEPALPCLTVKLRDEVGEVVRVEFTKAYAAIADVAEVELLFAGLRTQDNKPVDINAYVQESVVVSFSNKVFYDAKGVFLPRVYEAFRVAIVETALKQGVACPISTDKVVKPKEMFHEERFRAFPDTATQERFTALLPNTVRVVPVTAKK